MYLEQLKKVEQQRQLRKRVPAEAWLDSWRDLVSVTDGIPGTDSRYHPVLDALDRCDLAFEQGDWSAFQGAVEGAKQIMRAGAP